MCSHRLFPSKNIGRSLPPFRAQAALARRAHPRYADTQLRLRLSTVNCRKLAYVSSRVVNQGWRGVTGSRISISRVAAASSLGSKPWLLRRVRGHRAADRIMPTVA